MVVHRGLDELHENPKYLEQLSEAQVKRLACHIEEFGLVNPIIIDDRSNVIVGNATLIAAKELELWAIPTICFERLTKYQLKRYASACKKMSILANFERKISEIEHEEFLSLGIQR